MKTVSVTVHNVALVVKIVHVVKVFGDRPKRSFGGEDRPRRAVREEHFNQESRGERRRKFDR